MKEENTINKEIPSVSLMAPRLDSIIEVLEGLFFNSQPDKFIKLLRFNKSKLEEDADLFFDELLRILFDWIGVGDIDQIRNLLPKLEDTILKGGSRPYLLEDLSLNDHIVVKVKSLISFLDIFIKTDNLVKISSQLLKDGRYLSKCCLLKSINERELISDKEIYQLVKENESILEVKDDLDKLIKIGLLYQEKDLNSDNIIYRLTWSGRKVVIVVNNLEGKNI